MDADQKAEKAVESYGGSGALNLGSLTPQQLLALHASVSDELCARGIIRSANNPTGDLAEYLFRKAFGWKQSDNSHPNIDAVIRRAFVTKSKADE